MECANAVRFACYVARRVFRVERLFFGSSVVRPIPRVVHLVPALFGSEGMFGGAERYDFELARHMARTTPTTLVSFGDVSRRFATLRPTFAG